MILPGQGFICKHENTKGKALEKKNNNVVLKDAVSQDTGVFVVVVVVVAVSVLSWVPLYDLTERVGVGTLELIGLRTKSVGEDWTFKTRTPSAHKFLHWRLFGVP